METNNKSIQIVYAGRRKDKFLYFQVHNGLLVDEFQFKESLFKSKIIGAVYNVQKEGSKMIFKVSESPQFIEFENKVNFVIEWKLEDSLVDKVLKAKKSLQNIHKFEDLLAFKTFFKTKSDVEKQQLIADLIYFLNS